MRYPVRLFLGNEEVEFSNPPDILFNYSETELTNPTIIKNAYSKTITIEGTPKNNRIFGHIYDMQRILGFSGSVMGSAFNPLVKTDFTLYYNGSVYESGYFKLDEVRRNDNNIEYDISLFGGLGDYFYNLSFREDGNSMELSDLKYEVEDWAGELGFQINKETVKDAWLHIWQPSSKWDTINFAPCYNGLPSSLSADKYLINTSGMTVGPFADRANTGYIIGASKEEHTEWESFDLRSYLQRPVIRVKEVLKAIANPVNNGGYTVNLDSDFFTPENPYYWDSWMTLPLLTELDVPETVSSALTVTAITHESDALYKLWDGGANATNVQVDVNVNFTPSGSYSGDSVYLFKDYKANGGVTLQSRFAKSFWADSAILVQMLGYNASGQISTVSNVFRLVTPPEGEYSAKTMPEWMRKKFKKANPATDITGISNVIGKFTKKNGQFVFTDLDGNTQTLRFTFPSDAVFTKLKLKILPQYSYSLKRTLNSRSTTGHGLEELNFWSSRYRYSNSWQDEAIVRKLDKVDGSVSYSPVGATGTTTSFEGFYSNRTFTKKDLLTVGITPAQFLLSYAKAFGLYFIKDVEKKEISILSRHNFYKRDEIVNINDLIDKGSDIKIIPNSPKYQYYDFAFEQVDSEAAEAYRKTYGNDYGTQVVNTGYQYEKEHKHLLDGNAFKGGINVMEKNKYFLKPTQGIPCLVFNGFSYTYENSTGGTTEVQVTPQPMAGIPLNSDHKYYDFIAKPQFHTANNEASDGAFVLLFFSGNDYSEDGHGLKLTDDLEPMYILNDGQPCWLITMSDKDASGNTIALTVDRYPIFTRDIYNSTGYISNSFDLGTPLTTYVPDKFVSDWQNIYSRGWKSYISDLYDVNTRILRCRCLLRERPNPDWMRRFYWFDNSYWRLNQIKDWDISSFDTTEMEFIKVQDISDYDNVLFSYCPVVEGSVEMNPIDYSAHTLTGRIYVSDGSSVSIGDVIGVTYSDGTHESWSSEGIVSPLSAYGTTNVQITINIPANTGELTRTISIPIKDGCDKQHYITIRQGIEDKIATISPTSLSFDYTGGTKYLSVSDPSNHGWSLSENSDWISLSHNYGTGNTTISVTATTSPASSARTAEIIFRDITQTGTTTVSVSQEINPANQYLTITAVTAGWVELNQYKNDESVPKPKRQLRYSLDGGSTWTYPTNDSYYEIYLDSGDTLMIKGSASEALVTGATLFLKLHSSRTYATFNVGGNILSVIYGDNFSGVTTDSRIGTHLESLFRRSNVVSAKKLVIPFTTITGGTLRYLFMDCKLLTETPILPATSLSYRCYSAMFKGCTALVTPMATLPATVLAAGCYANMFEGCTSLASTPMLPATNLTGAGWCYSTMFKGCTSLVAPMATLPATTLDSGCYYEMFRDCTSLTTAPVLPATTLYSNCYGYMFTSCSNLNYVKCLAHIPAPQQGIARNETLFWLYGVAETGTFVKTISASVEDWERGGDGIPTGWLIEDAEGTPATIYPTGQQNFDATGGTKTLTVTDSSNHGWTISNTGTSWISISPSAGTGSQIVTVTAQANGTANSRSSIIVFQDNNSTGSTTIPVSQAAGVDTPATITPTRLHFDDSSNTQTLTISDPSNHGWHINKSKTWFSLSATGGTGNSSVIVTAQANRTVNNRTANFTFYDNVTSAYTNGTVYQPKFTGKVDYDLSSTGFTASGGIATITISDVYQLGWSLVSNSEWVTFAQTEGTGSTAFTFTVSENQTTSGRTADWHFNGTVKRIDIYQSGQTPTPTFSCLLNFTYGDVTAPQTATWDEYNIYYNITGGNPVEDEKLMMSISCGTILYQGTTWNPTISSYYSVSSPFVDAGSVSQIEVPQSLAGQTIYLKVEFGSAEAGYAIYSELVTVQIPSSGGTVNVTIPKF